MASTSDQRMNIKLQQAASRGDVKSLRSLIRDDPNILLSKTVQGNTVLHIAARLGHRAIVKEIFRHDESLLQLQNSDGDTPLHFALRSGHKELAALLVNHAAVSPILNSLLQAANAQGNTVLHEAVICQNTPIAQVLLDAGRDNMGHVANESKETPLDIAVRNGLTEVVKKILAHPSVQKGEEVEQAVFFQAMLGGHTEIAKMLLEMRTDFLEVVDEHGNNALHYAVRKDKKEMVKMLLERDASLAYRNNKEGQSPLHEAALNGSSSSAEEILKYCPDTAEQVDFTRKNAIHIAVQSGKIDTLRCLLKHVESKEIINKADEDGNTPLHLAAKQGRIQSTLTLLNDNRIDPCLLNKDGQTARSVYESLEEMSIYGMVAWKKLKKKEAEKCKNKQLPPVATLRSINKKISRDEYFQLNDNIYTLVAALIATVTFAANFTMPGGFDQQYGMAILEKRPAFKVFVIANAIAMCSSLVVLLCFMLEWKLPTEFKLEQLTWGHRLTVVACVAMLVTWMAAVHVVLTPKSWWLSVVVILIGCSTPVVAGFILGRFVWFIPLR